jgi:nitroreductase
VNVPDTRALVCGMALGYPDTNAPVNNYRTAREPVAGFTTWHA